MNEIFACTWVPKCADKAKIRVAHELPKRRRIAIKEALDAHQTEDRPEWDRSAEWGNIRLYRKIIKTGTIRTISLPPLEVDLETRGRYL